MEVNRSDLPLIRITVDPTVENGLVTRSQIMIDKAATVPRAKIGSGSDVCGLQRCALLISALARFLSLG